MQTLGHVEQNYTHDCVLCVSVLVLSLFRMNDVSVYGIHVPFAFFPEFVVNFP